MRRLSLVIALCCLLLACSKTAEVRDADIDQLHAALDKPDTTILDVRDVLSMGASMNFFKNSVNLPVNTLDSNLKRLPKENQIYVIGRDAEETDFAAKLLAKAGYPNVYRVTGGIDAYAKKYPLAQ